MGSFRTKAERDAILRGVYEDNLRMTDERAAERLQGRRRRKQLGRPAWVRWGTRLALMLTVLVTTFGGVQIYRELRVQQPQPAATVEAVPTVSAAERMALEFEAGAGTDEPPGLEREVPIAQLFDLEVKTIVLDPGHGGRDPGATGPTGTREKDITLDVARRLHRRLELQGFQVLMTREDDRKVSLHDRVAFANEHGADLFLSIHVNAFADEDVQVVETYYFGLSEDERTLRLANRENSDSEFSNAEFMEALDKVGKTMKFQESKQLATSIQKTLYRNIRSVNSDMSDWGAKAGPFAVLLGVEVPSILAEVSVISNADEELKLNTPEYREQLAASLEAGVVNYLYPGTLPEQPMDEATNDGS